MLPTCARMQIAFHRNNPALKMEGKLVRVLPMIALHVRIARLEFIVENLSVVTKMNAAEMQFQPRCDPCNRGYGF